MNQLQEKVYFVVCFGSESRSFDTSGLSAPGGKKVCMHLKLSYTITHPFSNFIIQNVFASRKTGQALQGGEAIP